MEERDQDSKINTLEESLNHFNKPFLLEKLDISLELVRRNKEEKENLSFFLKSVDKDLLKLSRIHHPDKAIGKKKSDGEVTNAQNRQIALNATRNVLKALTEVFLKDIDVHYKYEFFAKLDINTLINEKQIDLEISNILCKISRLSEVKRVNIVGEIRKFLIESQESLNKFLQGCNYNCVKNCDCAMESFRDHNKHDFVRHRDNALHHLHKCIEGYAELVNECKLIVEDCRVENDENTRRVIKNIFKQSQNESKILQELEKVAKRSLDGNFEIFPISEPGYYVHMKPTEHESFYCIFMKPIEHEPVYCDLPKPIEHEPVSPSEHEYFVSPFTYYVDVLLMCSIVIDKKTRRKKIMSKIGETFEYYFGSIAKESIDFIKEPELLKAYYLASYINNKNHYKDKVEEILKNKGHYTQESCIIRKVFKETVIEIEQILVKKFDINSYKEGKSNREQFNERLFKLNDSMAEFDEAEKNLQEKFKLYKKETNEIRKECLNLYENIEKMESVDGTANQTTQIVYDQHQEISEDRDKNRKLETEEIPSFHRAASEDVTRNIRSKNQFLQFTSIDGTAKKTTQIDYRLQNEISEDRDKNRKLETEENSSFHRAASEEVTRNIKSNNQFLQFTSIDGSANQITQILYDLQQEISADHDKKPKLETEEIPNSFHRATSEKVTPNIKSKNQFLQFTSINGTANQTTQLVYDQLQEISEDRDKNPKLETEEI